LSLAGLLTKIVNGIAPEITSRGLTAYFLQDLTLNTRKQLFQTAVADGLRTAGVTVGDITDAQTQTFNDRGVLIVYQDQEWMEENVFEKLKTAIQIRWIIDYGRNFAEVEDFERVLKKNVVDGAQSEEIHIWKRIKVYV